MNKIAFKLYLLFTISWFLHFTARFPSLGSIRFDLLLIVVITIMILAEGNSSFSDQIRAVSIHNNPGIILVYLLIYVFVTLPFVVWPGSVLSYGIRDFLKGTVFYYFTIKLITSIDRLKIFMIVFLGSQIFRVLEPLYLHFTDGYWGSIASMDNWEYMNRLAGAPSDIINPNGLAFVIVSIYPFLYFLSKYSKLVMVISLGIAPMLTYALILTASRTGFVAVLVILFGIIVKSAHRVAVTGGAIVIAFGVFLTLSSEHKDRYLSLFDSTSKNAKTVEGRTEGIVSDLGVALQRPLVGHGLGTSLEANSNFAGVYLRAHNLYLEILQEIGLIGLLIFLVYMKTVIYNFKSSLISLRTMISINSYLLNLTHAMQVWLLMNIIFSFASYGLSSYEWYLFGGLGYVLHSLSSNRLAN